MAITKYNGILFGGDYCPEQWPEEIWKEDMEAFRKYHVNAVTLNVHGWCSIEPRDGEISFARMDRMMDMLSSEGIQVVMATGTAALPMWLLKKYPQIMSVHMDGVRNYPGKRVNYCPNSPDFRREIRRLAGTLAGRYADRDNIILWHLGNELEGHCYCDTCAAEFRKWLQKRFGTIECLNESWNTMFWGHCYSDWEEIRPPRYDNAVYQDVDHMGIDLSTFPTETIEYLRFMSESWAHTFEIEKEEIRKYIPDAVVTNNFQYRNFDYDTLSAPLDVVSYDTYPGDEEPEELPAFRYDLTRGMNGNRPFLIMEMSPNHASWSRVAPAKRPGQVSAIAMSAIGRGAESAMFFQMRRSRSGYEKFHGAFIEHSGRTDTKLGKELTRFGEELASFGDTFTGTRVPAKAAVLFDWNSRWELEIPSGIQKDISYEREVLYYYRWFYKNNIPVDVVRASDDLRKYEIVIAPMLYKMEQEEAANIRAFVDAGGTFVTTCMSGMADRLDRIWLGGYPALLRDVLGIWVEETDALRKDQSNHIRMDADWLSGSYRCGYLCDVMHLDGAKPLGKYAEDYYAGTACITENRFGNGLAVYIGTKPEQDLTALLLDHYCREKGVKPLLHTPEGVEAMIRVNEEREFLFLVNHSEQEKTVDLGSRSEDPSWRVLLTGETVNQVQMSSYGQIVLERENIS